ncbi:hypothetical protein P7C70_g2975, partial [Phenoliferia sp. Uapishka_3]
MYKFISLTSVYEFITLKARDLPPRPPTIISSSHTGYSQLQANDPMDADDDLLPPSYSNPFHEPRSPAPYPPIAPPSFLPTSSAIQLTPFTPSIPAPSATNHLAITHKHTAIRGSYHIDTSIIIPPHLVDNVPSSIWSVLTSAITGEGPESRERPNALFVTDSGQIDLVLYIRGGGRANVRVEQKGGGDRVRVAIVRPLFLTPSHSHSAKVHFLVSYQASLDPDTTLSLTVTASCNADISLPPNFRGLIRGGSERGQLRFSDELKANTSTFSVSQENPMGSRYFIGDWQEDSSVAERGESGSWSGATSRPAASATNSTSNSGREERKGPLLIAETAPDSYEDSSVADSQAYSGSYGDSSSTSAGASSSTSAPQVQANPQTWMGHVITVTSEHGNISLETMAERAARIAKREQSWGTSVWRELGGCCVGVGTLTMACFGCPDN